MTTALDPLHELQRVIYLIGLGGILIAIVLGITLTNNLTRPIHLLLNGIKRIEREEYDQPVAVVSRIEESESLGFTLIKILAQQLEADINIESQNGTDISIVFEKQDKKGASSSLNLNSK